MPERNTFTSHQNREILSVDFSGLKPDEFARVVGEAKAFLLGAGKKDLLLLYDITGSKTGPEAVDALKEAASATRPFVRKRAVVGIHGVQRIILQAVNAFSQEDIKPFDDMGKAKDWLVEQP